VSEASEKLDTYLGRVIEEIKPKPMSKIEALAAKISASKKGAEDRLDNLMKRVDAFDEKLETVASKHEGDLDAREAGVESLEEILRGSNT
jgi:hypothetical protein